MTEPNHAYESRMAREDEAIYRWWQARLAQPDHPVALLVKDHPRLVRELELIVRSAFTSGVNFAANEASEV